MSVIKYTRINYVLVLNDLPRVNMPLTLDKAKRKKNISISIIRYLYSSSEFHF